MTQINDRLQEEEMHRERWRVLCEIARTFEESARRMTRNGSGLVPLDGYEKAYEHEQRKCAVIRAMIEEERYKF